MLNGERLADGTLHDRLFVVRVDAPPEPILQLSFNRTGEVPGGRALWRLREDKTTKQHHIELYRRDHREDEHLLVVLAWDSASQTFIPMVDSGQIKWYVLPADCALETGKPGTQYHFSTWADR